MGLAAGAIPAPFTPNPPAPKPGYKYVPPPSGGLGPGSYVPKTPQEQASDAAANAATNIASNLGTSPTVPGATGGGSPASVPRIPEPGGSGTPGSAGNVGSNGIPPPVPAPDIKAAQDAEMLRAKEKQGQIAASSLSGLHEALGDRQMLGSGAESMATADVANEAAGNLSDLNVAQMKEANDQAERLAELSYNGGIAQRGQDIGAQVAYRGQDVTQRGQDLQRNPVLQNIDILNALKGLIY